MAAATGYLLSSIYDLPPPMFTAEEIDAIVVGARHVQRPRDPKLQKAAESALAKVTATVPESLQSYLRTAPFYVPEGSAAADRADLAEIRESMRSRRKIAIAYVDADGRAAPARSG